MEITRSFATRCAIRHWPGPSPGSTSWPATSANNATASACFSLNTTPLSTRSSAAHTNSFASSTSSDTSRSRSAGSSKSHGGRPGSRLCSRTRTSPSSEMSLRTRRICAVSIVIVSWRATASSSTVESNARRCLPANTSDSVITERTASKIRCGRSERRSLPRHNTSTVEWNASSVNAKPVAAFQPMFVSSCPDRFSIRQALQRLEHHHCRDHISRHRRTAPLRREQISEHVIRKQTSPVLSQKRVHRSLRHQMRTQRRRIQQLTIRNRRTLHPPSIFDPNPKREHPPQEIAQQSPSS